MPRYTNRLQIERIEVLHRGLGLGPREIRTKLEAEFGKEYATSKSTIVRVVRRIKRKDFSPEMHERILSYLALKEKGLSFEEIVFLCQEDFPKMLKAKS